ncbi:hypothetical protein DRE_07773 [Drechslerella stenobrocha 248]|uniref:Formin GTPase-binding domain-containing protein n=1 Tax=Drechslerella stenobrocha 248 TaxID=1043628 RepID=W7HXQ6_9PEZI|nr:hypothetical protein DRE_07773 [Drechslerella stenobrocha 248]
MAAAPPSPTKRSSRLFGRHRHSQSVGDMAPFITDTPQLPPLNFSFVSGAPEPSVVPAKPTVRATPKAKHAKSPSLLDLFTKKKDVSQPKKDSGFTIIQDDDCTSEDSSDCKLANRNSILGESRVLQPSVTRRAQPVANHSSSVPLSSSPPCSTMTSDDAASFVLDQENSRPLPRPSRINVNKALPPIRTDIPIDVAREISLYTPRLYNASGQRNFGAGGMMTPGLRSPQSRPNSVYGNAERKSSWGSIVSLSRRSSVVGPPSDAASTHENVEKQSGFLSRVMGVNSSKRVHPAALDNMPPSTSSLHHEFNNLLSNYGLPHNIKDGAAGMTAHVKATLLKSSKVMSNTPLPPPSRNGSPPARSSMMMPPPPTPMGPPPPREKKRRPLSSIGAALFRSSDDSRPRGKTFSTIGMPAKHSEDKARPRTTVSERPFRGIRPNTMVGTMLPPATPLGPGPGNPVVGPLHANAPSDFVAYLRGIDYINVDLGWLRRLKRMLRNERLAWVESFFEQCGLDRLVDLIKNIYDLEYHDLQSGNVLREVFLCLKAAYTAPMADARFDAMHEQLFTMIVSMMFDEERKKTPYEYETREAAVGLIFTYLAQAPLDQQATRARSVIKILENPPPPNNQQGLAWVEAIKQPRPFTRWSGEVARLAYETGWVWYHPGNRIALRENVDESTPFNIAHFPTPRAFMAIEGGSVNSIEMNVANYAALHLELMNAILAYLPAREERNEFRALVQRSGMEKNMGQVLRCAGKGKHYEHLANMHVALSDWVTAAKVDGWESWEHVRTGRFPPEGGDSKVKAMKKIEAMYGPQFELPDMGLQDTVVERKRMSVAPEQDAFQVGANGGVVLEWDF